MTIEVLPNFLLIGAPKCGTTALYHSLGQHPEIYVSRKKEPNYFGLGFGKIRYRSPSRNRRRKRQKPIDTLEAYLALFKDAKEEKAIGEGTTGYLYNPDALGRIERVLPDVKLIAILRNPVDRAFSNFMHAVRNGIEPISDFAAVLEAEQQRIRDNWDPFWHYRQRGLYYEPLKRYFDRFGADRIGVYLYDDFKRNPVALLQDVFRFLGVDGAFVPQKTSLRINRSGLPRSRTFQTFLRGPNRVRRMLRWIVPRPARLRVKARLQEMNLRAAPPLPPEVRVELMNYYREDLLRLQDLIGRDLSRWMTEPTV